MRNEFDEGRTAVDAKSEWKRPAMRILPAKEAENTGVRSPADTGDHTLYNFHS